MHVYEKYIRSPLTLSWRRTDLAVYRLAVIFMVDLHINSHRSIMHVVIFHLPNWHSLGSEW